MILVGLGVGGEGWSGMKYVKYKFWLVIAVYAGQLCCPCCFYGDIDRLSNSEYDIMYSYAAVKMITICMGKMDRYWLEKKLHLILAILNRVLFLFLLYVILVQTLNSRTET